MTKTITLELSEYEKMKEISDYNEEKINSLVQQKVRMHVDMFYRQEIKDFENTQFDKIYREKILPKEKQLMNKMHKINKSGTVYIDYDKRIGPNIEVRTINPALKAVIKSNNRMKAAMTIYPIIVFILFCFILYLIF